MTGPQFYRKRSVLVKMMQFTEENRQALQDWLEEEISGKYSLAEHHLLIETLEGDRDCPIDVGYWIAQGTHGEFYPIHPDIQPDIYEPDPEPQGRHVIDADVHWRVPSGNLACGRQHIRHGERISPQCCRTNTAHVTCLDCLAKAESAVLS